MGCKHCQENTEIHAKGLCYKCYRKHSWKPSKIICKRCKQEKSYHGRGLCRGCYSSVFQIEAVKAYNRRKLHNIDNELYQKITTQCILCGFDKIVDLHHLDHNHKNNNSANLVGLCPNHHKMLHHRTFQQEIYEQLIKKGYSAKKPIDPDTLFKKQE
ncbi:MAG: hypothetical protein AABX53_01930 [Nanoarchaeota archaeon]